MVVVVQGRRNRRRWEQEWGLGGVFGRGWCREDAAKDDTVRGNKELSSGVGVCVFEVIVACVGTGEGNACSQPLFANAPTAAWAWGRLMPVCTTYPTCAACIPVGLWW